MLHDPEKHVCDSKIYGLTYNFRNRKDKLKVIF